jgi:hypothetical protein
MAPTARDSGLPRSASRPDRPLGNVHVNCSNLFAAAAFPTMTDMEHTAPGLLLVGPPPERLHERPVGELAVPLGRPPREGAASGGRARATCRPSARRLRWSASSPRTGRRAARPFLQPQAGSRAASPGVQGRSGFFCRRWPGIGKRAGESHGPDSSRRGDPPRGRFAARRSALPRYGRLEVRGAEIRARAGGIKSSMLRGAPGVLRISCSRSRVRIDLVNGGGSQGEVVREISLGWGTPVDARVRVDEGQVLPLLEGEAERGIGVRHEN